DLRHARHRVEVQVDGPRRVVELRLARTDEHRFLRMLEKEVMRVELLKCRLRYPARLARIFGHVIHSHQPRSIRKRSKRRRLLVNQSTAGPADTDTNPPPG